MTEEHLNDQEQEQFDNDDIVDFAHVDYDPDGDYEPVLAPLGQYQLILDEVEPNQKDGNRLVRINKSGHPYIMVRFVIADDEAGMYEAISHYQPLPLGPAVEATEATKRRNNKSYQTFMRAIGFDASQGSMSLRELGGEVVEAVLDIRRDEAFGDSNVIKAFVAQR